MFTRKQYMNKEVSHQDYYRSLGADSTRAWINSVIGMDRLLKSEDEHLNDIPLITWDGYYSFMSHAVKRNITEAKRSCNNYTGKGFCYSQSDAVCVAKACARQMIEEAPALRKPQKCGTVNQQLHS